MTPCSNRSEKPSACASATGRVSKTMVMRRSSSDVNSRTVNRRDRAVAFNRCALSRPAVDSLAVQMSRSPRRAGADAIRLHSSAANATHRRSVPAGYTRISTLRAPSRRRRTKPKGKRVESSKPSMKTWPRLRKTCSTRCSAAARCGSKVSKRTLFITRPARLALVLVDRQQDHELRPTPTATATVAWCCVASQSPARLLRQRCDPEAGRDFQIAQR